MMATHFTQTVLADRDRRTGQSTTRLAVLPGGKPTTRLERERRTRQTDRLLATCHQAVQGLTRHAEQLRNAPPSAAQKPLSFDAAWGLYAYCTQDLPSRHGDFWTRALLERVPGELGEGLARWLALGCSPEGLRVRECVVGDAQQPRRRGHSQRLVKQATERDYHLGSICVPGTDADAPATTRPGTRVIAPNIAACDGADADTVRLVLGHAWGHLAGAEQETVTVSVPVVMQVEADARASGGRAPSRTVFAVLPVTVSATRAEIVLSRASLLGLAQGGDASALRLHLWIPRTTPPAARPDTQSMRWAA